MPLVPIIAAKTHNLQPDGGFLGAVIAIAAFFLETIIIGAIASAVAFGIGKAFG
jgi:hypothetical protein